METTGRKFKCIGLREKERHFWNKYFKIGEVYFEHHPPLTPEGIYLCYRSGFFSVDADQFEEVKN